jgi:hypothetical protein
MRLGVLILLRISGVDSGGAITPRGGIKNSMALMQDEFQR